MKVTAFEIQFDSQQSVFLSGTQVSGKIIIQLAEPTKMRGIRVQIVGKGKSHWDEGSGKHRTKYRGRETYCDLQMAVFGVENSPSEHTIHPEGTRSYPFAINLDCNFPSSFEGTNGFVRYTCSAIIDRPLKANCYKTERLFTVIRPYDLNLLRNALDPIIESEEQTVQGCCCEAGSINIELKIQKSAYVPGEPIMYDIKINNKTDKNVDTVRLLLRQTSSLTGTSEAFWGSKTPKIHTAKSDIYLFNSERLNIKKNTTETISKAVLIPPLPPSGLEGCSCIDLDYSVVLKVPCSWTTVKLSKKMFIGTIPINTQNAELENAMAPPPYSDLPPSYEECVFGKISGINDESDEETSGQANAWAPAYPFFHWRQDSSQSDNGSIPIIAQPALPDYNQI